MKLRQLIFANLDWGMDTILIVTTAAGDFRFTVEDILNERNGNGRFLDWEVESFVENQVTLIEIIETED